MSNNLKALWEKANTLVGCLAHLNQKNGRRRYSDDDGEPLNVKDDFISDTSRTIKSKAWRAMCDKTQVFTSPRNILVRNRLTHVAEVVSSGIILTEQLGLNCNLFAAAAWVHDTGHGPFGHQGEMWMAKAMGCPNFCHETMGVVIAQKIERAGKGTNLTHETLEAMRFHSGDSPKVSMSQEAWVLRLIDKIYLFHDINDIWDRMKYPIGAEIISLVNEFGSNQRERESTVQAGIIVESAGCGHVSFEQSDFGMKFTRLRKLMYEIYPRVTQQNVEEMLGPVLRFLDSLKLGDPFLLLALMTDGDVMRIASTPMKDMGAFNSTAISKIVPYLPDIGKVDLCDPDLDC